MIVSADIVEDNDDDDDDDNDDDNDDDTLVDDDDGDINTPSTKGPAAVKGIVLVPCKPIKVEGFAFAPC